MLRLSVIHPGNSKHRHQQRQGGFTLLELLIVIVILIVLGATVVPSMRGYFSNSRQKATADIIRSRIAEARAKAIETGSWVRVAVSGDNKRIRVGPDCQNFESLQAGDSSAFNSLTTEDGFEDGVTAKLIYSDSTQASNSWTQVSTGGGSSSSSSSSGSTAPNSTGNWNTVVTIGPEGICREGVVRLSIEEGKFQPITVEVRGITASSEIIMSPPPGNNK